MAIGLGDAKALWKYGNASADIPFKSPTFALVVIPAREAKAVCHTHSASIWTILSASRSSTSLAGHWNAPHALRWKIYNEISPKVDLFNPLIGMESATESNMLWGRVRELETMRARYRHSHSIPLVGF